MGCGQKAWAEEQAEQEALEELGKFSLKGYESILHIIKKVDWYLEALEGSTTLILSRHDWVKLNNIRKQLDLLLN